MSDFQKDELTLEETNKLRISLGLKPLTDDSASGKKPSSTLKEESDAKTDKASASDGDHDPLENQDEKAARNYQEYQDSLKRKKEEDAVRDRIAKAQNRRELNKKLQGRGLGEAESSISGAQDGDADAKRWIKAQRKRAKENAERRLREEAEAEEAAAAEAARAIEGQDLTGLRVGHDVEDLDLEAGGEARILTLKDSKVLDNEDDELMDTHLARSELDRKNSERKKGTKKYTGLDDDEFQGAGERKRGILSNYDSDIDGKALDEEQESGFRLGAGAVTRKERTDERKRETDRLLNRQMLDLDYNKNEEVSDYLKEGDVGFKKPKKKKRQRETVRVRLDDDDEVDHANAHEDVQMSDVKTDSKPAPRVASSADAFLDDDDLAASLARARRKQAKRTFQKLTPEQIARNLRQQEEAEEAERAAQGSAGASHDIATNIKDESLGTGIQDNTLTFDGISEFVRNIQAASEKSPRLERNERVSHAAKQEPLSPAQERPGVDVDALMNIPNQGDSLMNEEDHSDENEAMGYYDEKPKIGVKEEDSETQPEEPPVEPLVGGGLASTLSYLKNQGLVTEITPEQREREQQQREYDAWLALRRVEDKVREAELAASKAQGSAKDQATREYENRMRELDDARKAQDKFKNYNPDIDIKYHDEFGRVLNSHEAWKRLSHQFHGKLPGRKKQNQRLQRIEDERKQQKMLAGDTPSGIANAFTDRTEKSGQAHMVLGVGNRNNAPQEMGMLGPNTLSRPDLKGKMREGQGDRGAPSSAAQQDMSGIDSIGITSMVPRSTTSRTRAGFAPVRSSNGHSNGFRPAATEADATGQPEAETQASASPSTSKFKLAFGKRPNPSAPGSAALKQPRLDA